MQRYATASSFCHCRIVRGVRSVRLSLVEPALRQLRFLSDEDRFKPSASKDNVGIRMTMPAAKP
jgi:hypothetical protein